VKYAVVIAAELNAALDRHRRTRQEDRPSDG
jgi:hypothetical protein